MRPGPRFTIGGWMGAVAVAAAVAAVLAASARSAPGRIDGRQLVVFVGAMVLVIGIDLARLVRRARAGRPDWSLRAFLGGMVLVWVCLCVPFLVMTRGEPGLLLWLPLAPVAAGFAVDFPIRWVIPLNDSFEWLPMLMGSILLVMATARLMARGWLMGACYLALAVSGLSAVLIATLVNSV